MTAEELWEKKEIIGCILVVLFFAGGLAAFKYMGRQGDDALGTLTDIRYVGQKTKAYDVTVFQGTRIMFKERLINLNRHTDEIEEKQVGDSFEVTWTTLDSGASIITSVGDNVEPEK